MAIEEQKDSKSTYGLVGDGLDVTGEISFVGQLQVDGRVYGNITTETGTLTIGKNARIEASVDTAVCVVYGTLVGDIVANTRIEIGKTGCIEGSITTPALHIEEGAIIKGTIKMKDAESEPHLKEINSGNDLQQSMKAA